MPLTNNGHGDRSAVETKQRLRALLVAACRDLVLLTDESLARGGRAGWVGWLVRGGRQG